MKHCALCGRATLEVLRKIDVCIHCEDNLALRSATGLWQTPLKCGPLASLWNYRGSIRQKILDFKLGASWQSGMLLRKLFTEQALVEDWVAGADYLVPVPSSLWSRNQGRHDLAFALTQSLCELTKIPLLQLDRRFYSGRQKQSFLPRSARHMTAKESFESAYDPEGCEEGKTEEFHVVLIDDVVTTANTLTSLAQGFRNMRFKFLTLASAYHPA